MRRLSLRPRELADRQDPLELLELDRDRDEERERPKLLPKGVPITRYSGDPLPPPLTCPSNASHLEQLLIDAIVKRYQQPHTVTQAEVDG